MCVRVYVPRAARGAPKKQPETSRPVVTSGWPRSENEACFLDYIYLTSLGAVLGLSCEPFLGEVLGEPSCEPFLWDVLGTVLGDSLGGGGVLYKQSDHDESRSSQASSPAGQPSAASDDGGANGDGDRAPTGQGPGEPPAVPPPSLCFLPGLLPGTRFCGESGDSP